MRLSYCKNYPVYEDIDDDECICEPQRKELFLKQGVCISELQKKELSLKQKEKDLLKQERILHQKISKFNKQKKCRAEKDLIAAAKLRDARKKILYTVDTKGLTSGNMRFCRSFNKTHLQDGGTMRIKRVEEVKRERPRPLQCSAYDKPDACIWKLFCKTSVCKNLNKNTCQGKSKQEKKYRESYSERAAGDCYSMSMRRPPQLWLYSRWPQFYPQCQDDRRKWKHLLIFLAGILFWTPCLLCLEMCRCCFCSSCTE